jgi:hypothetical protein
LVSRIKLFSYIILGLLYLALVGLSALVNPILGIIVAVAPLLVYLLIKKRGSIGGSKLKIPIFSLSKKIVTAFYTDAPESEVNSVVNIGREMGLDVKAFITLIPGLQVQGYKILVYGDALVNSGSVKQKVSLATQSVTAILLSKGYRVLAAKSTEGLSSELDVESEKEANRRFPMTVVFSPEDFGQAVYQALCFTDNPVVVTSNTQHLFEVVNVCVQTGGKPAVLKFGHNFGFNPFESRVDPGFIGDVARLCYQMSQESALLLASILGKALKENAEVNPFLLRDLLEAAAQTERFSSKVRDQLLAFSKSLTDEKVWRGLVVEQSVSFSKSLRKPYIIDVSNVTTASTLWFVSYALTKWLIDSGAMVVLDGTELGDEIIRYMLNDVRVNTKTCQLIPKRKFGKDVFKSAETVLYLKGDEDFYRLVADQALSKKAVNQIRSTANTSYLFTRPNIVSAVQERTFERKIAEEYVAKIVMETAPPIQVPNYAEKPYLATLFNQQELESIVATLNYIQGYGMVEQESAIQALGLKTASEQVLSRLLRQGYLKRVFKSGIQFVELTEKGEEELQRLKKFLKPK